MKNTHQSRESGGAGGYKPNHTGGSGGAGGYQYNSAHQSREESWETRFDKQFGKAGSDRNSDSIGRGAGCDDCYSNIKMREEHKSFVRSELEALGREMVGAIPQSVDTHYANVLRVVRGEQLKVLKERGIII